MNEGLLAVRNGGTVFVHEASEACEESVLWQNKADVNLVGVYPEGEPDKRPVVNAAGLGSDGPALWINSDVFALLGEQVEPNLSFKVQGLSIRGGTGSFGSGILFDLGYEELNITLLDCSIENNEGPGIALGDLIYYFDVVPPWPGGEVNIAFSDNQIRANAMGGIQFGLFGGVDMGEVAATGSVIIESNTIESNGDMGLFFGGNLAGGSDFRVAILNNRIESNASEYPIFLPAGIACLGGNFSEVTIFGNDILNNWVPGGVDGIGIFLNNFLFYSEIQPLSKAEIAHNRIAGHGNGSGILIAGAGASPSEPILIENNIIENNGGPGAILPSGGIVVLEDSDLPSPPSYVVMRNNLLERNTNGIQLVGLVEGDSVAVNNTIADSTSLGLSIETTGTSGFVSTNNNIVWGNGVADVMVNAEYPDTVAVEYSDFREAGSVAGVGNISEEPLFIDPSTDNYRLQSIAEGYPANSPCVNAGDPDAAYNDVNGSRNDMGYTGGPYGFNTYGGGGEDLSDEGMSLSFNTITQPGKTTIEKLTGFPAEGFPNITLEFLTEPIYYSVSSTAEFDTVDICVDLGMELAPFETFIKLYYYENDVLTEIPDSYVQGTEICANNVTHFCPIVAAIPDTDRDGQYDHEDNCPDTYNPDQADIDGDGVGNACEGGACTPASTVNSWNEQRRGYGLFTVFLIPALLLGLRRMASR